MAAFKGEELKSEFVEKCNTKGMLFHVDNFPMIIGMGDFLEGNLFCWGEAFGTEHQHTHCSEVEELTKLNKISYQLKLSSGEKIYVVEIEEQDKELVAKWERWQAYLASLSEERRQRLTGFMINV
ncbi:MAG: hypothetical protein HQM11_07670 [SAR324 cluster bacterium]|nr:hypothetical protein [SAR324 cluster bacterium]